MPGSSPASTAPSGSAGPAAATSHLAKAQMALQNPNNTSCTTSRKRKWKKVPVDDDAFCTPWIDSLPMTDYESKEQRLHDEIMAYTSWIMPTPQEATARQQVFQLLEKAINSRFQDAEVRMYGSVAQNLCLPDGDIDIVVSSRKFPDGKIPLFQLSPIIKQTGIAHNVHVNRFAKVPVMTLQTTEEFGKSFHFILDLCGEHDLSYIDPIKNFLFTMPALRPLVLVLKGFLTQRKLNSAASSGLSSYAVICMVISFLQLNPNRRPAEFIENPMESQSLGTLLMDFLLYYGQTFPYTISYISVTHAKILPKDTADWINNNPSNRLAIQCLVRPDNDIAKSAGRIEVIREAFRETWNILTKVPITSNNLQVVVRLHQVTLDHREHIRDIVDSGSLAEIVMRNNPLCRQHAQPSGAGAGNNCHSGHRAGNHLGALETRPSSKRRRYDRR